MKLSDNDIRDITGLLEEGKPLPDKYRFMLFGDDREIELVWNGKSGDDTKSGGDTKSGARPDTSDDTRSLLAQVCMTSLYPTMSMSAQPQQKEI